MTPEQFHKAQEVINAMRSWYSLPSTETKIGKSTDQQYRLALEHFDLQKNVVQEGTDNFAYKPSSQSKMLILTSALKHRSVNRLSQINIDTDNKVAAEELSNIMFDLDQVLGMRKGLFQRWIETERATGKSINEIITGLNDKCGTGYGSDWLTEMKGQGYKSNRLPRFVLRYMKQIVAEPTAIRNLTTTEVKLIRRVSNIEKQRPHWREELDVRLKESKYRDQYIIQRITGCRTEELTTGVRVEEADDGDGYLLHIVTAKGRAKNDEKDSDRIRVIRSANPLLSELAGKTVTLGSKNKLSYRTNLARITLRMFGTELSPYALRYAITSDLKHAGLSSVQRAEFLGHSSMRVVGKYSRGMNTGGAGREPVARLEKARVEVKPSTPPYMSNDESKMR